MYKMFFIARNNIKKQKGDMITFLILTLLASYLFFQCASALAGMPNVMESRFEEVNGAHVYAYGGDSPEEIEAFTQAFSEKSYIVDLEKAPYVNAYAEYRNTKNAEFEEYSFFLEDFAGRRRIMDMGIDSSSLREDDILLPYYLNSVFAVGDTLELRFGENVYPFHVAGYVEDPIFCSSINITIFSCYTSKTMMEKLVNENPVKAFSGMAFRGIADTKVIEGGMTTITMEKEISEAYHRLIAPSIEKNPEKNYLNIIMLNWDTMRGGGLFLPNIIMAVVMMFGVLILTIAFIIITHGVRNFIRRNMKSTGILEAAGYTVSMLRRALIAQIALVALLGALIGVALAILTNKTFGDLVSSVLGMSWNQPILWGLAAATVAGVVLVTAFLAWMIGGVYKKITVLDALRGGLNSHNYKKNYVPLDKTSLPVSVALSLKSTLGGFRRSLLLVFIIAVLAIAMACGFGMYENFGAHEESMATTLGLEFGKAYVTNGDLAYADEIRQIEGVTKVLCQKGMDMTIAFGDYDQSVFVYVDDAVDNRVNMTLLEGRVPVHDNEIMLTQAAADDLGVEIGDVVTVRIGVESADYIVTGFDQRMERMGRTANLTIPGAEKLLGTITRADIVVNAEDDVTYEELEAQIRAIAARYNDTEYDLMNSGKNLKSTLGTLSSAMKAVCIVIAVITLLIVVFTETLIIRAKITREWRDMGISKALGATSRQLIVQIMLSNLPAVLLGGIVGLSLSNMLGSRVCILIFSLFGMRKICFNTPVMWMLFTLAAIVFMAVASAGVLGLRVRKMKPVEMITEE